MDGLFLRIINSPSLAAFRHRNFRLFYSGQIISLIGFWMQNIALSWVVLELTNSPVLLGLVTFIQFLPNLLFSLFAGVIVDRWPRRTVIVGTQATFMILALILTLLSLNDILRYWHIIVFSILMGVTQSIDVPARQAFLVEMVGKNDLINAIALNSSMFNAARVIGPALGGIVLAAYGATACFFINTVSFAFVIGGLLAMKLEKRIIETANKDVLGQIKEGIGYIWRTPTVFIPMVLLASLSITAMNFGVLIPVFARDVLGQGPDGFGGLVSAQGLGSLAGAVILVILTGKRCQLKLLWLGATGLSLFQILLGQMHWYWATAALLVGAGWSMITLSSSVNSLIQIQVPDELRGRVMSVYSISFIGLSSLGGMFAGAVAKRYGAQLAFTLGGLLALLATVLLARKWRRLKQSYTNK
ncbi:MFS transporter [Desulfotomaculum nigrificans]|uniref:MFS transporter n=1 Tax=Desulfotomaculum nigrificans TaxID=1565 RepID=UPI0001FAECB5|nr:MFS transporter [Desulfotomaculum nigrificans]